MLKTGARSMVHVGMTGRDRQHRSERGDPLDCRAVDEADGIPQQHPGRGGDDLHRLADADPAGADAPLIGSELSHLDLAALGQLRLGDPRLPVRRHVLTLVRADGAELRQGRRVVTELHRAGGTDDELRFDGENRHYGVGE